MSEWKPGDRVNIFKEDCCLTVSITGTIIKYVEDDDRFVLDTGTVEGYDLEVKRLEPK